MYIHTPLLPFLPLSLSPLLCWCIYDLMKVYPLGKILSIKREIWRTCLDIPTLGQAWSWSFLAQTPWLLLLLPIITVIFTKWWQFVLSDLCSFPLEGKKCLQPEDVSLLGGKACLGEKIFFSSIPCHLWKTLAPYVPTSASSWGNQGLFQLPSFSFLPSLSPQMPPLGVSQTLTSSLFPSVFWNLS